MNIGTKNVETMTLRELSLESFNLKQELEKDPNNIILNDMLAKVSIERKKKKLEDLYKDLEFGGPDFLYIKPNIKDLENELTGLGVNVSKLESNFVKQSLYISR